MFVDLMILSGYVVHDRNAKKGVAKNSVASKWTPFLKQD